MTYPDKDYEVTLADALKHAQSCLQVLMAEPAVPDSLRITAGSLITVIRMELHRARERASQRKALLNA
jgi:hypothetical protein